MKALVDSPDSFRETLSDAEARPDSDWAQSTGAAAEASDRALFVAEFETQVVGMTLIRARSADPCQADLFAMWVDPAARRTGVGRALLDAAISWAESNAVTHIHLSVTETNDVAMRLYLKAGFRDTGNREAIRPGSALSARIMVLTLPDRNAA